MDNLDRVVIVLACLFVMYHLERWSQRLARRAEKGEQMGPEDDPADDISEEEYFRGMAEASQAALPDCLNCGMCESCIKRSIAAADNS